MTCGCYFTLKTIDCVPFMPGLEYFSSGACTVTSHNSTQPQSFAFPDKCGCVYAYTLYGRGGGGGGGLSFHVAVLVCEVFLFDFELWCQAPFIVVPQKPFRSKVLQTGKNPVRLLPL